MKTLNLYKPIGVTPLQCIEQFKLKHPEYKDVKLGYAGRLDPMAEGLLLVLVGDENKKKHDYEGLDKEYEFEILFGVSTDSYDMMGKITSSTQDMDLKCLPDQNLLNNYIGTYTQTYPPYSSVRVKGKPLFYWARENKLNEITIPTKKVTIYDLKVLDQKKIPAEQLKQIIFERIIKVNGEFRQQEILEVWKKYFDSHPRYTYHILRFTLFCSSGTYVRALVHDISQKIGVPALTLSIKRTKVGERTIEDALQVY